MRLSKKFPRCRFKIETIRAALNALFANAPDPTTDDFLQEFYSVAVPEGSWRHDNIDEFFADYVRSDQTYLLEQARKTLSFSLEDNGGGAIVRVEAPSRETIQRVFETFDGAAAGATVEGPPTPEAKVFIGHGRSQAWRDLKDHLHDQHGIEVIAYETGARAGHSIRDVLDDLLTKASFAVLVMTGEDLMEGGGVRARQNVVHEAGLFQGRLGFSRAVILLEDDVEEFTNIAGIHQIRFAPGRIRETYGDVLATIRREFA